MTQISTPPQEYNVIWEKLPPDFVLPDDPVENINQPFLAAALTEALDNYGFITDSLLIASNFGLCAKVNGKTVVKAPDWLYVPCVFPVAAGVIRRSYTPHTEGDVPAVVMEFLSETDAGEYSVRPTYPYGKMWFYERILQIPTYVIFDTDSGMLEVRQLISGRYEIQQPDAQGRYLIAAMALSLGVWYGKRLERTNHWLRWWDQEGSLLLWGSEQLAQEREKIEQERQRAEAAEQEVASLRERLRQGGLSDAEGV
ncbi:MULTISPECIES: Uma2 family endonuclease [unclassified Coleofasciculus]|uniref:Uma2 family endonuclease n=1 Tax=unclassified Coleofasciculus TaxID=2692782 RepID=UPI00187E6486|nr:MULTISPECIES: Uma2 family endonuclease [unclassified Coleofasciculus]MBE9129135.1 Uma2 family endonuclease [Coleofasciculus sp. LEGE 07081]MBE9149514.1 Uma2 family endonuclease [Coleofasciculus sp. LEGE 07092]